LGPVYQAGTLSGNPLAMAAGIATITLLREQKDEIYPRLERLTKKLALGVVETAKSAGVALQMNQVGSMFTWFFSSKPIMDWSSAEQCDTKAFGRFFRAMFDQGVYLPPSQYEAAFVSTAHTEEDAQSTIEAAKTAFAAENI
jgi:glutamate-1-semialdehyde 2,1-aminomutase